jgi:hypothetical protein
MIDVIIKYSKIDKLEIAGLQKTRSILIETELIVAKTKTFFENFSMKINEQFFLSENSFFEDMKQNFDILVDHSDKGLANAFNIIFDEMHHDLESLLKVNNFIRNNFILIESIFKNKKSLF